MAGEVTAKIQFDNNPTIIDIKPKLSGSYPLQSSSPNQIPVQSKSKQSILEVIIYIFSIIIGLITAFVIFKLVAENVFKKISYFYVGSNRVPDGYSLQSNVQALVNEHGLLVIFTYVNNEGSEFFYSIKKNVPESSKCFEPTSGSFINNYSTFIVNGASDGCVMTLNEANGSNKRFYKWRTSGNTEFSVTVPGSGLSDEQILNMANSQILKLVFIDKSLP